MKKCLNCNINIGGNTDTCPLCQNSLTGEASANNWPSPKLLKARALIYRLQLFMVLTVIVVALSLDFLMSLNNGTHYSLIIAMWLIVFELQLRSNIRRNFVISRTVSNGIIYSGILLLITGYCFDFYDVAAYMIVPILLTAALLANTTFSMVDTTDNALVYLLGNILLVIVIYTVMRINGTKTGLVWTICLMVSIVSLIGIIVFKGRKVSAEIQKRMNF